MYTWAYITHTQVHTYPKEMSYNFKILCYPLARAIKLVISLNRKNMVFSRLCQKRPKPAIVASCSECLIPLCLVIFYDVLITILNILNKLKSRMKTLQQRLVFCFFLFFNQKPFAKCLQSGSSLNHDP